MFRGAVPAPLPSSVNVIGKRSRASLEATTFFGSCRFRSWSFTPRADEIDRWCTKRHEASYDGAETITISVVASFSSFESRGFAPTILDASSNRDQRLSSFRDRSIFTS